MHGRLCDAIARKKTVASLDHNCTILQGQSKVMQCQPKTFLFVCFLVCWTVSENVTVFPEVTLQPYVNFVCVLAGVCLFKMTL